MNAKDYLNKLDETAKYLSTKFASFPKTAVILGSGLGDLAEKHINEKTVIPYAKIPNMPSTNTEGHSGNLIIGKLKNKSESQIAILQGRIHHHDNYLLGSMFQCKAFVPARSEKTGHHKRGRRIES